MRFDTLRVRQFRNLRDVEFAPDPRFNVVVGPNGHGKTNLLESVYVLAALKSFRGQKNRDLVAYDGDRATIEGRFDRGGMQRDVRVTIRGNGKKVEVNDKTVRNLADFFGTVNTVVFTPEDIGVMRGSPSDRRLLLDRMIFNARPAYAAEMTDYEAALKNRNRLLRDEHPDRALLAPAYEEQLVPLGAAIVRRRQRYIAELAALLEHAFREIFGDGLTATWTYESSLLEEGDEGIEERFHAQLRANFARDCALGYTSSGPQRDDIAAAIDEQPVKAFASQGQQRAFVLALKITEIRQLRAQFGYYPILLLDDVSSELDPERNRKLFDFLSAIEGQVFISTTDVEFIRLAHPFRRWDIRDGALFDDARGET